MPEVTQPEREPKEKQCPLVMDKKHFVSKGLGACKNSGSSSLLSFVSLHGGPELGFLNEGMSAGGETLQAVSKTKRHSLHRKNGCG